MPRARSATDVVGQGPEEDSGRGASSPLAFQVRVDLDTTHAPRVAQADAEKQRRERERREFKEAQELESLRRAFKRMDKKGDGKIDVNELMEELEFLGYKVKPQEAALIIWEVDDDADDCVDWEVRAHLACLHNGCLSTALPADSQEFRTMFYRIRDDTTGAEPRKLFNGAPARAGWAHARLCDSPGGVRVAVVEVLMHDKNYNGSLDLDECVTLLYQRYGKARRRRRARAPRRPPSAAPP